MIRKKINSKALITNGIRDFILISLGILSATFALKSFLLPNDFIDGGVTGISLLISYKTHISVPLLIFLINIPFILLAYKQVAKQFAIKTFFAIVGLAISLALLEFPTITKDKLLIAIFGGFFLGAGIGSSVRGGSVIDGTEVLAVFLAKKLSAKMGDVLLILNAFIFGFAALLLGMETALYSILTYLSASKTVDFIVEGIEEYIGVTIISERSDEVRRMIVYKLGRGVTIYKGERGYRNHEISNAKVDIIFTVVTRLEIPRLKAMIKQIDASAFIIQHTVNETVGGVIKKRPLKH